MGLKYTIRSDNLYYCTLTVVDWLDVFTRPNYRLTLIDSLRYCQQHKGLELYAWCLMSNHLHLIARAAEGTTLSDILRDFKKFTSKAIVEQMQTEPESRREWLLDRFAFRAANDSKRKYYQFWQDGLHAVELLSNDFITQKLDYIHHNPVRNMLVAEPEHYLFSSAANYAGQKGLLNVLLLE